MHAWNPHTKTSSKCQSDRVPDPSWRARHAHGPRQPEDWRGGVRAGVAVRGRHEAAGELRSGQEAYLHYLQTCIWNTCTHTFKQIIIAGRWSRRLTRGAGRSTGRRPGDPASGSTISSSRCLVSYVTLCARLILSEAPQKIFFLESLGTFYCWKSTFLDFLGPPKNVFFTISPKILHNTNMRSHKKFHAKKMIFRGASGTFYQNYAKGGTLEHFEKKNIFFKFFSTHLKSFIILVWGHTKGPKQGFLGVLLEGGSQREKKSNLAFGVSLHWVWYVSVL